jgi:hypothetical protein
MGIDEDDVCPQDASWDAQWNASTYHFDRLDMLYTDPETAEVEAEHPFAYAAKVSTQDEPSIEDVMDLPSDEQVKWLGAMEDEFKALESKGTFETIPLS